MPKPKKLRVRSYKMGFGDCFLLTFEYSGNEKHHMLIDFGSSAAPKGVKKSRDHFMKIANNIEKEVGNQRLDVLVATHRHSDHISCFATSRGGKGPGDLIAKLRPRAIIQPWTEDPQLRRSAKAPTTSRMAMHSFVSSLDDMQTVAVAAAQEVSRMRNAGMKIGKERAARIGFHGETNIKNKSAVVNLMNMGKGRGKKPYYVYYGKRLPLGKYLPGVRARVLGPPTLKQSEKISKQRKKDEDEFWHMQALAGRFAASPQMKLFADSFCRRGGVPASARWFTNKLQAIRGEQLWSIVRTLDKALNNTSVILLIQAGNQKLLFSGDAQIENWLYALAEAGNSRRVLRMLRDVTVYKVGHHGSLNATPKTLWDNFQNKSRSAGDPDRLKTLLSTMKGKHGSPRKKTEVPRKTLVAALKTWSKLYTTEKAKNSKPYVDVSMDL